MRLEKSCGAVIYRDYNGTVEFLTVRSKAFGHWGFPKGHVEEGETEEETAKREVLEETGLEINICSDFRTSIEYSPKRVVYKEVIFFIGKPIGENVTIQEEEIADFRWLDYENMLVLITYENEKKALREAMAFLKR